MEESQPLREPRGSWRLSLKEVRASISARVSGLGWAAQDSKWVKITTSSRIEVVAMESVGGIAGLLVLFWGEGVEVMGVRSWSVF